MDPDVATASLWAGWFVSWWLAAFWRDRSVQRPPAGSQIGYRLLTMAGVVLLFGYFSRGSSRLMLWVLGPAARSGMVVLVAAGLLFTWWARLHLGRLWSGGVTRKADHRIVDTGPYRLVRHPIYTGVILAETATAVQSGSVQALAGAVLMFAGFYLKARMEERFLNGRLAPGLYDAYARRVPMLVPFGPRSR